MRLPLAISDRVLFLWNLQTGARQVFGEGSAKRTSALAFSPDRSLLVSASLLERQARLWDLRDVRCLLQISPDKPGHDHDRRDAPDDEHPHTQPLSPPTAERPPLAGLSAQRAADPLCETSHRPKVIKRFERIGCRAMRELIRRKRLKGSNAPEFRIQPVTTIGRNTHAVSPDTKSETAAGPHCPSESRSTDGTAAAVARSGFT